MNNQHYSNDNGDYRYHQQPSYPQTHTTLQQHTLAAINPAVQHGLREAQHLGFQHALTEAVAIGYLMGRGYNYQTAWRMVESWWRPQGTPLPTPY
ncbi:hypothetical protein CWR48_05370 [Oceanobacillus arenosus]|uniref:Uncharacterized protein n=1 Tax=Oceanobacillus arenosus TaxID=1229153 RepID=A0A3D8PXZ8_9BACI|nr:hypothetical protein [Oceanobacillus arenosus]RDW20138.1 hypothetical protein CWR48_05370 [Oceanobacillus arenosus]